MKKTMKGQLWGVEYSEYSKQKGMYPFHVDTLDRLVKQGFEDMISNGRGENKWCLVFCGSEHQCHAFTSEMTKKLGVKIGG